MPNHQPAATGTTAPESGTTLARGAIGLREVLFQSITHMAPAVAVAFSIIVGANFAAGALPLAVVIALVACLCVAFSMGELARHLPSAGGMYTYTARGLHPAVGFLVAWAYAIVEPLVAPLLYLIFGFVMAGTLNAEFGWSADLWWPWTIAAAVVVFILGYFGIRVSAGAGTILGFFEILVFAALALWLIFEAGGNNDLAVFGTTYATVPDFEGMTGVFAASIYAILAFIGFEAAAPLAEEAKDPERTVRQAVVYSCLLIGLFYVLTTYGATVFFGPERMGEFAASGGGNPWDALARSVWGAGWVLAFLAIQNSAIANSNAAANAATRTWFAMGRIRILPSGLARIHPRFRSPHVAVVTQLVVALVASLALGFAYDPLTAFVLIATVVTAVIILIYVAVNISCIAFYLRERRGEFNAFKHLVVPIVGILFFIPAWLTAMGITVFSFVAELSYPISLAGPIVGVALLIGVIYLIVLYTSNPQRIRDTGKVFIEEEPGAAAAATPV
ncbi:MAG: APC family permease [Actinomycetota bacterium]